MLNPDTAVAIFGYAGDWQQIRMLMPFYLDHKCPVVVYSPEDSPINAKDTPKIKYRFGGARAYTGQASLDRQVIQMERMLAEFPQKYFLLNDSDSVCFSPKLPAYLYEYSHRVWSNEVSDVMHYRPDPKYPWPRIALQPPYFLTRENIQKWIDASRVVKAEPQTPFLDWAFMAWSVHAGLEHASYAYAQGVSCPTRNYEDGRVHMERSIRNGAIFCHSIKDSQVAYRMARAVPKTTRLAK